MRFRCARAERVRARSVVYITIEHPIQAMPWMRTPRTHQRPTVDVAFDLIYMWTLPRRARCSNTWKKSRPICDVRCWCSLLTFCNAPEICLWAISPKRVHLKIHTRSRGHSQFGNIVCSRPVRNAETSQKMSNKMYLAILTRNVRDDSMSDDSGGGGDDDEAHTRASAFRIHRKQKRNKQHALLH